MNSSYVFNIKRANRSKINKKGQVMQVALLMIAVFAIIVTVLLGRYVLTQFYAALDEGGITTVQSNASRDTLLSQYNAFDYSMVILCFVLIIGLIITSFMIPTHPIFFVINVIGIFVLVFLGMVINNVYAELVSGEGAIYLGDTADLFPLSNFLITRMPYIGAIVIFIISIIMFTQRNW